MESMKPSDLPSWSSPSNNEPQSSTLQDESQTLKSNMELSSSTPHSPSMTPTNTMTPMAVGEVPPPSNRTLAHKGFRLLKFITIMTSLLLFLAQVVSVVYLPFDGVEIVIKLFTSSFCVLIVVNELEWSKMLRESPLLWNWVPKGFFYAFIGIVSIEENNLQPSSPSTPSLPTTFSTLSVPSLTDLASAYSAALFIETVSWMMFALGTIYFALGLLCCQMYQTRVREDYGNRLEERRRVFEGGMRSDSFFGGDVDEGLEGGGGGGGGSGVPMKHWDGGGVGGTMA